eukprot:m.75023 g.75023  ORF g.75023 m.75023 type:complete len:319 (+) comp24727_c0_seq1:163-1119(+)
MNFSKNRRSTCNMYTVAGAILMGMPCVLSYGTKTILIAPGVEMPFVNIGGVSGAPSNYSDYLHSGGSGLDTALTYGDAIQKQVGIAVRSAVADGIPRKDIFVTTKVPCCSGFIQHCGSNCDLCYNREFHQPIEKDIATDLAFLGSVDLMLLHWPCATVAETVTVYQGLEKALLTSGGKIRAIGVSNFNASFLKEFLPLVNITPAVNQCSHSVGGHNATHDPSEGGDDTTAEFCKQHGISYSAWSPLGGLEGKDVFKNPTVIKIAQAHGVSGAQVALKWLVQQNISVVTAADKHDYILEDLDLFSFELTQSEMVTLAAI